MLTEEEILRELRALRKEVEELKKELEKQKEEIRILKKEEIPPEPIPYKEIVKEEKIAPLKPEVTLEESIGVKWLPRLGMVALLFGIGFFLKYAFEHYWIGPTGRVILGLIAGILLLFGGEYFESKKFHTYSRIFTGGGLASFYLSLWAACRLYSLITPIPTFLLMSFLTIAAGFFAQRYNSLVVAFYALVGGFITPVLVGPAEFPKTSDLIFILTYFLILDLGILGLAFFKKWRVLNFAGFIFTAIAFLAIYSSYLHAQPLSLSISFLTLYFLIFAFVAFVYNILRQESTLPVDIYLIIFNTLFYYGFSYYLLKPDYANLLGLFTFCLSIFYLILAYLAFSYNPKDKYLVLIFLGICAALVAAGISLQLKQYWITIFWTIEALILVWIGFKVKEYPHQAYPTRVLGLIFLIPPLIRLFAFDSRIPLADFTPILNKRVLVFLIYIFALGLIMKFYSDHKKEITEDEKNIVPIFTALINFLAIYLMSREIVDYFGLKIEEVRKTLPKYIYKYTWPEEKEALEKIKSLENQRNMWLSVSWALYSFILIGVGIAKKYKLLRWTALFIFGITILKVFFLDLSFLKGFPRILSFIILGFLLLGVGFIYNKYKEKIREFI
jgi:uncharacterized membrane protein